MLNTAITFEYDVPSVGEFASRITNTLEKYPYIKAVLPLAPHLTVQEHSLSHRQKTYGKAAVKVL